eukprot:Gb_32138 [translate_table: standard]
MGLYQLIVTFGNASRLDKYEEQEKCLANSVNELGELCKNTIEEVKEAKVDEDKKKEDWAKMIENQIQRLQEGLDATSNSMNQQTNNFTGLQNGMEILQSLPQRVNSLEEIIKNAPNKYIKQEANGEGTCGKGDSGDGDAQQGAANGEDKGEILGDPFETLQADLEEHNDRLHLIEEQEQVLLRCKAGGNSERCATGSCAVAEISVVTLPFDAGLLPPIPPY